MSMRRPAKSVALGDCHRRPVFGYSLLEVLIAVAIIAILAAFLFPAIKQIRNNANAAKCLGNLRVFGMATLLAISEHDGLICPGETNPNLVSFVNPYLPKPQMLCPNRINPVPYAGRNYAVNLGIWSATGGIIASRPASRKIFTISGKDQNPLLHNRVVLASENYSGDYFELARHLDRCMWGGRPMPRSATEPHKNNPAQYHGDSSRRGLNMFMLDGSSALIIPSGNGGWESPEDSGMSPGETYGMPGNSGYYYDRNQLQKSL